jgi:putative serine protease PepD
MSQSTTGGRSRRWIVWAAVGAALVVGGVVGGVIGSATASTASPAGTGSAAASTTSTCQVGGVANQVLPSVVTISAQGSSGGGTGSGEVIKTDGYILTNNHVIAAAANGGKVEVMFSDGATAPATITGRDPLTDLAVLKVNDQNRLKAIELGTSSSVRRASRSWRSARRSGCPARSPPESSARWTGPSRFPARTTSRRC